MIKVISSARSDQVVEWLDQNKLWGSLWVIDPEFEDLDKKSATKLLESKGYHQEDVAEAFKNSGLVIK